MRKSFSALKTKLLTIAPSSHFNEFAASIAVLAVVFKTIIFKLESNSFKDFSTLLTGSLFSTKFTNFKNSCLIILHNYTTYVKIA